MRDIFSSRMRFSRSISEHLTKRGVCARLTFLELLSLEVCRQMRVLEGCVIVGSQGLNMQDAGEKYLVFEMD